VLIGVIKHVSLGETKVGGNQRENSLSQSDKEFFVGKGRKKTLPIVKSTE